VLAHLLGDVLHEVDDELGLAAELRSQLGVLGCHADGTRVEVAHAHHHASADDQRCRREPELLGAEQRRDHDIAACLQLTIGLYHDAIAETIEQQRLLRLGESELPRRARVLQRRQRTGARPTVVTTDQHHVGLRLADPSGDGADTDLGNQLHVDASGRICVLEVVDELLEVLDRVDVVVRRRADEAHSGGRMASRGNPRIYLVTRELSALARLGALGHLDL
jgi:hypothetical protein